PYANEVLVKLDKAPKNTFQNLSDPDSDDILEYMTDPRVADRTASAANGAQARQATIADFETGRSESINSTIILISLLVIGGLLIWLLLKLRQLVKLQQTEELSGLNETRVASFSELYQKYNYIGKIALGILGLLAFYGFWNWLMWIGVYKGYQPEQPIHFSHKIHAGDNKIDCQMCHSSAKYGKVSEIPSMN